MFSPRGIIVFESKNYSGWIFGTVDQLNWTKTLPSGHGRSHKEHFYNPVMQNANHIKHLRTIVGDEIPIYSIIVFSERCTLKSIDLKDISVPVINRDHVQEEVERIFSQNNSNEVSADEIDRVYNTLLPFCSVDKSIKQEHINSINEHFTSNSAKKSPEEDSRDVDPGICPRCGGKLVLRTTKKGEYAGRRFLGCSNFPKCRYTQKKEQ